MASSTSGLPAIVGAAQIVQHPATGGNLRDDRGPIELMVDAARDAASDAGAPSLLSCVEWIGVAGGFFRYKNPGALVARQIGATARGALAAISGSAPQEMLAMAATRISSGEISAALVVGGEARWTATRLKRAQREPRWMSELGDGPVEAVSVYPDDLDDEGRLFAGTPLAYALMEDALRHSLGRSVAEHRDKIAELWARFSAVAADNPWAWDRTAHSAEEIREPSPSNRMIAFPYTKAMVANNTVDMASAVLLCNADLAAEHGVSRDSMIFPHVVTKSHETWKVASRRKLDRLPAVSAAGTRALELAGVTVDDLAHIDLYACFPSIVQMTARELGIDVTRTLTVTGGLGFAAAAIGNAVGHSMAAIVPLVRAGGLGFIHGNGGLANTHTFGVYSAMPPERFTFENAQHLVRDDRCGALPEDHSGRVSIDAATVVYGRAGPTHAIVGVSSDHRRRWVTSTDSDMIDAVLRDGIAGKQGTLTTEGKLALS